MEVFLMYNVFKKIIVFSTIISLLGINSGVSGAAQSMEYQGYVKIVVTGQNINLRDAPSTKGRVLGTVLRNDGYGQHILSINGKNTELYDAGLIAATNPIKDHTDNSTWYQLFFKKDDFSCSFFRFDKDKMFSYSTPYVNSRFVKILPLDDQDKKQIKYFKEGRPLHFKTGSIMSVNPIWEEEGDTIKVTRKQTSAYLEPKKDAKQITIPIGTKIVISTVSKGGPSYSYDDENIYGDARYFHMDMDDVCWYPIIGENKRILGWIGPDMGNDPLGIWN